MVILVFLIFQFIELFFAENLEAVTHNDLLWHALSRFVDYNVTSVAVAVAVGVTGDRWQVTGDRWHLTPDTWHLTPDTWHLTHDTWHMTPDIWHMTPDMWRGVKILSKCQLPISYGLGVMKFGRVGGKGWLNQRLN